MSTLQAQLTSFTAPAVWSMREDALLMNTFKRVGRNWRILSDVVKKPPLQCWMRYCQLLRESVDYSKRKAEHVEQTLPRAKVSKKIPESITSESIPDVREVLLETKRRDEEAEKELLGKQIFDQCAKGRKFHTS